MNVELGCGTVKSTEIIKIDISPDKGADIVADLNKDFPLKNNSVDEIKAEQLIEHLADLHHFFKESNRVLKDNGKLIVVTPNFFFWRNRLAFFIGKYRGKSCWHVWHCWLFKPSELKVIAESYGFEVKIKGHGLFPYPDLFYYNFSLECRKRP